MADFYLDNDVSRRLALVLRGHEHNVITSRDLDLAQARDPHQLLTAALRGLILVTHNVKDFVLLQEAWVLWPAAWGIAENPAHAGIFLLPQRWPENIGQILAAVLALYPRLTNMLLRWRASDGVSTWTPDGGWQPVPHLI